MILSHMEKLGSDRKVVLLTNVEYTIDRACEKLRRNYNYWWEKKQKSRGKQTFVEDQVSQREWSWKKILPRAINGRKLEITTVLKTAQRILFGVVCLRLWLYFKINLFNSKKNSTFTIALIQRQCDFCINFQDLQGFAQNPDLVFGCYYNV